MFTGPRLEPEAGHFVSFDAARLGLSTWTPEGEVEAVIIGLHGMNDYAETFYLAGPHWAAQGIATYAYDARGFGRSPNRGIWPSADLMVADLRAAVSAARRRHPGAPITVVGHSMGGAAAIAAFASDDPPEADGVVLVAPAVWGWSSLPDLYAAALWISAHTAPWRNVSPPRSVRRTITPSDNVDMLRKIGSDPLMLFTTRIDAIYGLVGLMERAADDIGRIDAPTVFLYGANDDIIPIEAAKAAAARLPAHARTAFYPQGYHMLLRDLSAERVWRDIAAVAKDSDAPLPSAPTPIPR